MSVQSKNHHPRNVDRVFVSQGSRSGARPANGMLFETYQAEYEHAVKTKADLIKELQAYSNAGYAAEMARLQRKHNREKTWHKEWEHRRVEMDQQRHELTQRMYDIESEIVRLKPLKKAEKERFELARKEQKAADGKSMYREDGTVCWDFVVVEVLEELRKIRLLLEKQTGATP